MEIEQAIALVDHILGSNSLSDIQEQIFRRVWNKEKYADIAEAIGYDANYVKDLGAKSWKVLSNALGEKVSKSNIQTVLRRHQSTLDPALLSEIFSDQAAPIAGNPQIDWGDHQETAGFVHRQAELDKLHQWIVENSLPLITISGIAGIGKSALAAKFTEQSTDHFEQLIWRSLKPPHKFIDLITELQTALNILPKADNSSIQEKMSALLNYFGQHRCLIILDGLEITHSPTSQLGNEKQHTAELKDFFQSLFLKKHRSTILITSRQPLDIPGLQTLGADQSPTLQLASFSEDSVQELLGLRGDFTGEDNDWKLLTEQYGGNPLALQIVSTNILDYFEGNVTEFISEGQVVFQGLSAFLEQQWAALSSSEQWLMFYLAMRHAPVGFKEIKSDALESSLQRRLTEVLSSLVRRSLILKRNNHFSLQTAISEYAIFHLVETLAQEITTQQFKLIGQLPLRKISSPAYLQNWQKQIISSPILEAVASQLPSNITTPNYLKTLITSCKQNPPDYTPGNLVNLFIETGTPISDIDLSDLPLWEVNFASLPIHQATLQNSDLSRTQFSHAFSGVTATAFSPNSDRFVTGHADGMIYLWDSKGRQIQSLSGHTGWIWDVCWTPNGEFIVSVSEDHSLRVWSQATGDLRYQLDEHTERIWRVICPSNTLAISSSSDRTIKIWDISKGICLNTLEGHEGDITALSLGADGEFYSGSVDRTLKFWSYLSGECLHSWQSSHGIWAIAYCPRTQQVFTGGDKGVIHRWEQQEENPVQTFQHNKTRIWTLALSPDFQYLVAGGEDNQLLRWNLKLGQIDRCIPGFEGRIWALDFNPSGEVVITASEDNKVHLWDIQQSHPVLTLSSYSNWACDVLFLPRPSETSPIQCVSVHEDGHIHHWNIDKTNAKPNIQGHQRSIWAIASHPQGTHIVTASEDQTLRIWNQNTGQCDHILRGHQRPIWAVDWSQDGEIIVSGSGDRSVKVWDAQSGDGLSTCNGHHSRIWSVSISPDSQLIASGSGDRTVKLWDRQTGECTQTLTEHTSQILSVKFHPSHNGQLAAAGGNGLCQIWNLDNGKHRSISISTKMIWSLDWSHDGELIALGGDDGSIHVWNELLQEWTTQITSSAGCIWSLAFHPDGKQICSASQDGTLRLWDIQTGKNSAICQSKRLYEGMNLMDTQGLTAAQAESLTRLGAKI